MVHQGQTRRSSVRGITAQFHPILTPYITVVSKAFQVLSDSDMRAAYDSNPSADPSSRFSGATATHRHHGGGFQGEVSPEDIFNMFFGGGAFGENTAAFGGPFGGSPSTSYLCLMVRLWRLPAPAVWRHNRDTDDKCTVC